MRGAGGTSGGVGQFFLGLALTAAGGWLITNQVTVTSGAWALWGYNSFGLSLVPLMLGIGLLFFNSKSKLGWVLAIGGLAIVFAGIIANLHLYFQPTSLFNTLLMIALLAAGLGLIARSLADHKTEE
jgi:predicted membrane channel-forming protein YqfA (hemolysin III family)